MAAATIINNQRFLFQPPVQFYLQQNTLITLLFMVFFAQIRSAQRLLTLLHSKGFFIDFGQDLKGRNLAEYETTECVCECVSIKKT